MAQNVKFIKGDTAKINDTSVTDGQLLYNTTTGQHYIDNESTRVEVGKPVVNTSAEVLAITEDNIPCGTKPVKELIQSLDGLNSNYVSLGTTYISTNKYTAPAPGTFFMKSGATAINQLCTFVVNGHIVNTQHYAANTTQCASMPCPKGGKIYYDTNSNASVSEAYFVY